MKISTIKDNNCLPFYQKGSLYDVFKILGLASQTLILSVCSYSVAFARGEITVINTETIPGTPSSYSAIESNGSTKTYHWGQGDNLKITGFEYDDTTFNYNNLADRVVIRRVDNPNSSGSSCSLFAERISNSGHKTDYPDDGTGTDNCDMAKVMGGRTINIGALDVFSNDGPSWKAGSFKNIERVDFIYTDGIQSPTETSELSQAGHVATEKSGNNPVKMAAILTLDVNGEPASYGSLVLINPANHSTSSDVRYGITNVRTYNNFLSNSMNSSENGIIKIGAVTENLGMAFVSLEDLGIPANSTYYGFSYFGSDMTSSHDLTQPSTFPLNSQNNGALSPGDADMYGGVAGYFVDICLAFAGDVSEVSPVLNSQIKAGESIYIPSRTLSPSNGHLKAYAVQANGSIANTATWDAGGLMTKALRESKLYTTDSSGSNPLILFSAINASEFNISGSDPTVADIVNYTMDPSYNSGVFLANRESGSFLGSISRGNDTALVSQNLDVSRYLADADYQTFQKNIIATRPNRILVNSDDGFLYAFDTSGALAWGWMPGSLISELKDYSLFQHKNFMKGDIDIVDAKHSGSLATYVVGGYQEGLGHYSLRLGNDGNLDVSSSFIWDEDRTASYNNAPNNGEMDYFEDGTSKTYAVYVVSTLANNSTIVIRNVADAADITEVVLDFRVTSTPFVMPTFSNNNAPAGKTLYVGDSLGNVRTVSLLVNSSGNLVLDSKVNLETNLKAASSIVGNLGSSEPILFLGASASASNDKYYLRAQSSSRLTLLQFNGSAWNKKWTSYVTGAGTWASDGVTYSSDSSGIPTDTDGDGFSTNVGNGIQSLPANATITDAAVIVSDSLVLPISIEDTSGNTGQCIPPRAYYYLYKLTDGKFSSGKYFTLDGDPIEEDLVVGYGIPNSLIISDIPEKQRMLGTGNSDQDAPESTRSFYISDPISTGIRGWQEIGQ